jgi:hypothetical protein
VGGRGRDRRCESSGSDVAFFMGDHLTAPP